MPSWAEELRSLRQLRFALERVYGWTAERARACPLSEAVERLEHLRPREAQAPPAGDLESELMNDLGAADARGAQGMHPRIRELLKK